MPVRYLHKCYDKHQKPTSFVSHISSPLSLYSKPLTPTRLANKSLPFIKVIEIKTWAETPSALKCPATALKHSYDLPIKHSLSANLPQSSSTIPLVSYQRTQYDMIKGWIHNCDGNWKEIKCYFEGSEDSPLMRQEKQIHASTKRDCNVHNLISEVGSQTEVASNCMAGM